MKRPQYLPDPSKIQALAFLGARNILASPVIPVNATQLQAGAPLPEIALITCINKKLASTRGRDMVRSTQRRKRPFVAFSTFNFFCPERAG